MSKKFLFKTTEIKSGMIDDIKVENYYLVPSNNMEFTKEEIDKILNSNAYKDGIIYRYYPETDERISIIQERISRINNFFSDIFTKEELDKIKKYLDNVENKRLIRENILKLVEYREKGSIEINNSDAKTEINSDDDLILEKAKKYDKALENYPDIDEITRDDIISKLEEANIKYNKTAKKEDLYKLLIENS